MSQWTADSWTYRKQRRLFLAEYPTCWICGHGGSDQVDHVIAVSLRPDLKFEVSNWRPAHGTSRCPTCGRRCNQERGTKLTIQNNPKSRRW